MANRVGRRQSATAIVIGLSGALTEILAQSPLSWDEPRVALPTIAEYAGAACVKNEVIVILHAASSLEQLASAADSLGDRVAGFIPRLGAAKLVLADGVNLSRRIEEYSRLAIVRAATPNHVGFTSNAAGFPIVPNDPEFPIQWHLDNTGQSGGTVDADIDAPGAWQVTRGSSMVTVAVIDTGIHVSHPEFAGRLLPGWDFVGEDPDPQSGNPHGTYVTGLIGANADNGFEVAGVDHQCRILPIKSLSSSMEEEFDVAQGLAYAVDNGADVISMSLGFQSYPVLVDSAVILAAESGAILVAAGGNIGIPGFADTTWPAASPKTISVGWTDHHDWRHKNSGSGNTLDFVAPGVDVVTVSGNGSYQVAAVHGSSYATPLVSGIVALLKSLNSSLTYEQVYELLVAGAEDQLGDPLDTPGWDMWYGHGRVNALASLQALCGCTGDEVLIASPQKISASTGGVIELVINFGRELAHQPYLTLGSATGTSPGFVLGGMAIRLTPDAYLHYILEGSNGVTLVGMGGLLDENGQAHAMIVVPELPFVLTEVQLHHQAVVLGGHSGFSDVTDVSNKTITTITPK